jgi:hypothetical protein
MHWLSEASMGTYCSHVKDKEASLCSWWTIAKVSHRESRKGRHLACSHLPATVLCRTLFPMSFLFDLSWSDEFPFLFKKT